MQCMQIINIKRMAIVIVFVLFRKAKQYFRAEIKKKLNCAGKTMFFKYEFLQLLCFYSKMDVFEECFISVYYLLYKNKNIHI